MVGLDNKSDGGGVVSEEEWGGPRRWYGKKPKGDENSDGKNPGKTGGGWLKGSGREGNGGGKGVGCMVGRDEGGEGRRVGRRVAISQKSLT